MKEKIILSDLLDLYTKVKAKRNNCDYSDIKRLLLKCGFELKKEDATHSIYKHSALIQHVNIVRDGNKVKRACYVDNAIKAIDELNDLGFIEIRSQ